MPILVVLMFLLGTELTVKSFADVARNPRAVLAGMAGQLVVLPLLAFGIAWALDLPLYISWDWCWWLAVRAEVPPMCFPCLHAGMWLCP